MPLSYRACPLVGCLGIEPSASFLSGKRSTNELAALLLAVRRARSGKRSTNELATQYSSFFLRNFQGKSLHLSHIIVINMRRGRESSFAKPQDFASLKTFCEARARIELAHSCFADSRVTTSPTRQD